MGSPRIFSLLLLFLLFCPGFGGAEVMGTVEHAASLESVGKSRKMMIEVADYRDPRPNRPTAMNIPYRIPNPPPPVQESVGKSKTTMIEAADYRDPRPNRPVMNIPYFISPPPKAA